MYCTNCGYKFEKYDENVCRLCGSSQKSYRVKQPYTKSKSSKKLIIIGIVTTITIVGIVLGSNLINQNYSEVSAVKSPQNTESFTETIDSKVLEQPITNNDGLESKILDTKNKETSTSQENKQKLVTKTITVSINDYPAFVDQYTANSALKNSVNKWTRSNPQLSFQILEEGGDIQINFLQTMGDGIAGEISDGRMKVETGSYDCRGLWSHYSEKVITDTIAHEIGHYLGLGHSFKESNLMYGDKNPAPSRTFNDLGYNIPKKDAEFLEWMQSDDLQENYEQLEKKYNELEINHNQLERNHNQLLSQMDIFNSQIEKLQQEYAKFPQIIEDEVQYQRAMEMYNLLNRDINEYNQMVNEENALVEKMNTLGEQMNSLGVQMNSLVDHINCLSNN